jgi:hypothetical protein
MNTETATRPQMPSQLVHVNEVRAAERETRCAEAWRLRLQGCSMREISEQLNVSVGTVADYLRSVLVDLKAESRDGAEVWRRLELDRLDALVKAWLPIAQEPSHPESAKGAAIVIRVVEAQSRLLGLLQPLQDAPPLQPEKPAESESNEDMLVRSPALRDALRRDLEKAERLAAERKAARST